MMDIPKFTANPTLLFLHCDLNWPFLPIYRNKSYPTTGFKERKGEGGEGE